MTYTVDWFSQHIPTWREVLKIFKPEIKKVLEIGSFEGRSAVWFIETLFPTGGDLYCLDWWQGSRELEAYDMAQVEARFDANTEDAIKRYPSVTLHKTKNRSLTALSRMLWAHEGTFDILYIDGGHDPVDVITDLTLCYHLCRPGGLIVCDDYLFQWGQKPFLAPKPAIDAFVNCLHGRLVPVMNVPMNQLFLHKGTW